MSVLSGMYAIGASRQLLSTLAHSSTGVLFLEFVGAYFGVSRPDPNKMFVFFRLAEHCKLSASSREFNDLF